MDKRDLKYKEQVEKDEDYEYIRYFKKGEVLSNGNVVKNKSYMRVRHKYCGSVYDVQIDTFVNKGVRCAKCCKKYENSFAYHIEVELGLKLEDVWDFEKNTLNPRHISKNHNGKVWIKCQEKDYHGSYEIACCKFISGRRCSLCSKKGGKVHTQDSFAQYHIDNTDKDFLDKYWDYEKNTVSPWNIAPSSNKHRVWIKCQSKKYHKSYEIICANFTNGNRCPYCSGQKTSRKDSFAQYHIDNTDPEFLNKYWDWERNDKLEIDPWKLSKNNYRKVWIKCQNEEVNELNGLMKKEYHGSYLISSSSFTHGIRCGYCKPAGKNPKVSVYDSFGYNHFDKVMSWHPDNNVSPFRVAKSSGKKYKFICESCGHEWESILSNIYKGCWCPNCNASKGEKRIKSWLDMNNIKYIHDEPYFDDLLSDFNIPLRPDFILPDYKIWIEYDGEFHFRDYYKDGKYERLIKHDKLKDEYAEKHGWNLIRIPYTEFDNIENILEKELNLNNKLEDK